MWRMTVYSPYFDTKTSWYKSGWAYKDAYAIYTNESVVSEHPEWVLHSASGEKLYIPWGCSGGTCPQYAGNIANAGFRAWWIEEAKASLAHGYRGLFIDDVNMEFRVGNGNEQQVAPVDPATGQPMTYEAWRRYMAQFMAQIRVELPGVEIVHNAIWFADSPARQSDPYIQEETGSANYVYLERGVNDSGLTGGSGEWSLNSFLSYAEQINARGEGVVLGNEATSRQGESYDLASYFLISDGNDGIDVGDATPEDWWPGWEIQLGAATGQRYAWNGLLRRDFAGGMVLVNPPGASTKTIALASPMMDADGNIVNSVTLPAASGAILRSNTPPPPAEQPTSPEPTQTTVETAPVVSSRSASSTSGSSAATQTLLTNTAPAISAAAAPTLASGPEHAGGTRHKQRAHQSRSQRSHTVRQLKVLTQIAGKVLRATRGSVTIQVEVRRGRRWRTVEHLGVTVNRAGNFTRMLTLQGGAHYRVRAVYTGASGFRPSRSDYRLVVPHIPRAVLAARPIV
jgi:hypothetical protein